MAQSPNNFSAFLKSVQAADQAAQKAPVEIGEPAPIRIMRVLDKQPADTGLLLSVTKVDF